MSDIQNYTFFNPEHSSNHYGRSCDSYIELLIAASIANLQNKGQCFTTADFTKEQAKMVCQIFENESHGHLLHEITGKLHLAMYVNPDKELGIEWLVSIPAPSSASERESCSAMILGVFIGALGGSNERSVYVRLDDAVSHAKNSTAVSPAAAIERDVLSIFMTDDDINLLYAFFREPIQNGGVFLRMLRARNKQKVG